MSEENWKPRISTRNFKLADEKQIMITRETTIINDLNGIISYQMFCERF